MDGWVVRVTRHAELKAAMAGVADWVAEQRKRKWQRAGHIVRREDARWGHRMLDYVPNGRRSAGRPVTRWDDSLEKFVRENPDNDDAVRSWAAIAAERSSWSNLQNNFVKAEAKQRFRTRRRPNGRGLLMPARTPLSGCRDRATWECSMFFWYRQQIHCLWVVKSEKYFWSPRPYGRTGSELVQLGNRSRTGVLQNTLQTFAPRARPVPNRCPKNTLWTLAPRARQVPNRSKPVSNNTLWTLAHRARHVPNGSEICH